MHGGIGLYRLAVKWGWFAGPDPNATRKRLKMLKWALTVFFLVLGFATLAAYIKIGIAHAPNYGQPYVPAALQPRRRGWRNEVIYTDVLVIGGGLAGLRVAIGAKRRGHDVIILSLVPPKRSHSAAAQGGMQASLANVIKGQGDTEDVHFEDTVRGSDWGADQRVVRMFVNTAPKAVRELAAWGVPWSRVRKGDRTVIINGQKVTITERDEAHGLVAQRDFGGTKKWRTCYVSDGTGHAMLQTMSDQAIGAQIPVHERTEAVALIHDAAAAMAHRAGPHHRRARRLCRQGDGDRDRRCRPDLPRHDQCGDLRRHRQRASAGDGIATLGNMEAVHSIRPASSRRYPRHRRLPRRRRPAEGRRRPPLHAGLRAGEEGACLPRRRQPAIRKLKPKETSRANGEEAALAHPYGLCQPADREPADALDGGELPGFTQNRVPASLAVAAPPARRVLRLARIFVTLTFKVSTIGRILSRLSTNDRAN